MWPKLIHSRSCINNSLCDKLALSSKRGSDFRMRKNMVCFELEMMNTFLEGLIKYKKNVPTLNEN